MPSLAPKLEKEHPSIQALCKLDEEYMSIEKEYSKEWAALQAKYEALQKPLLDKREAFVEQADNKVENFWLNVLQGHPIFNEEIQPYDMDVLKHLKHVKSENLPDETGCNQKGFKIIFTFEENEYMVNTELSRVYETGLESPFLSELSVQKIYMEEEIEWKVGKDVTIDMVKPKAKKGKKENQVKMKKVPRDSFFRTFFRTIDLQDPETVKDMLDKSLKEMGFDPEDVEDEEEMEQAYEDALEKVNDDAYEMGMCLRDNIIPFAVRWYTGEAMPDEGDYEGEGESDDEEDEEDDEEDGEAASDDDEEEGSPKKKEDVKDMFKPTGEPNEKVDAQECKQQ